MYRGNRPDRLAVADTDEKLPPWHYNSMIWLETRGIYIWKLLQPYISQRIQAKLKRKVQEAVGAKFGGKDPLA